MGRVYLDCALRPWNVRLGIAGRVAPHSIAKSAIEWGTHCLALAIEIKITHGPPVHWTTEKPHVSKTAKRGAIPS